MSDRIMSIEEFRAARERKQREKERELARAKLAAMEAHLTALKEKAAQAASDDPAAKARAREELRAKQREEKARDHELKRWKKKDYKPGRLAPDSTTQYTKTYKREVAMGAWLKKMRQKEQREAYHKRWKAADEEAKKLQSEARLRYEKRARKAAAKPWLHKEAAGLLVSDDRSVMSLEECAEELKVSTAYAPRVLREYGAELQQDGSYLRSQVLRAALVFRNDHPLIAGSHKGLYTYDEAAAFVGVHRDTIKHRARNERWPKLYEWNESVSQVCVFFRAAEVHHYKAEHDAWLNAGDSDHTYCLKRRQSRRNSPRKPKRR